MQRQRDRDGRRSTSPKGIDDAADVVEISRREYMTGRAKQREAKQLAIASAGSRSAYAIPVALLAFVLAYLYWPLRLVALVIAYMYWRNSR
jgi:fatty acid desaturase